MGFNFISFQYYQDVKLLLGDPRLPKKCYKNCWFQHQLKQKMGQNTNLPEFFWVNICKYVQSTNQDVRIQTSCSPENFGAFPQVICSTSQQFIFRSTEAPDTTDSKKHVLSNYAKMFQFAPVPSHVFQRFRQNHSIFT